ncbi:MAG: hypothetical protein ACKO96_05530, partial [Flammeovirgaceae bacterium]
MLGYRRIIQAISNIIGIDIEQVSEAVFSGLNTKACDLMSVRFKYNSNSNINCADRIYIVLHADLSLD